MEETEKLTGQHMLSLMGKTNTSQFPLSPRLSPSLPQATFLKHLEAFWNIRPPSTNKTKIKLWGKQNKTKHFSKVSQLPLITNQHISCFKTFLV